MSIRCLCGSWIEAGDVFFGPGLNDEHQPVLCWSCACENSRAQETASTPEPEPGKLF